MPPCRQAGRLQAQSVCDHGQGRYLIGPFPLGRGIATGRASNGQEVAKPCTGRDRGRSGPSPRVRTSRLRGGTAPSRWAGPILQRLPGDSAGHFAGDRQTGTCDPLPLRPGRAAAFSIEVQAPLSLPASYRRQARAAAQAHVAVTVSMHRFEPQ